MLHWLMTSVVHYCAFQSLIPHPPNMFQFICTPIFFIHNPTNQQTHFPPNNTSHSLQPIHHPTFHLSAVLLPSSDRLPSSFFIVKTLPLPHPSPSPARPPARPALSLSKEGGECIQSFYTICFWCMVPRGRNKRQGIYHKNESCHGFSIKIGEKIE